jgi:Zn-dependent M28 family amino/carboxypeptidase
MTEPVTFPSWRRESDTASVVVPFAQQSRPDMQFLVRAGVPYANLAQDASQLSDRHHSANDTLDRIDPEALRQNTVAYVKSIWLVANAL